MLVGLLFLSNPLGIDIAGCPVRFVINN